MDSKPNRYERWSSTYVCRDGQPIPMPPDLARPLSEQLRFLLGLAPWRVLLALAAAAVLALAVRAPSGTWPDALLLGGVILGLVLGVALAIPILILLVSLIFWPWTRIQAGEAARQETARKAIDELEAEICACELAMQQTEPARRWRYELRLEWLRTQHDQRLMPSQAKR